MPNPNSDKIIEGVLAGTHVKMFYASSYLELERPSFFGEGTSDEDIKRLCEELKKYKAAMMDKIECADMTTLYRFYFNNGSDYYKELIGEIRRDGVDYYDGLDKKETCIWQTIGDDRVRQEHK